MPWLRHFALFVVFVTALFRPAAAAAFVPASDAGSQARVGAFELVAATLVGHASGVTCGLHEGIGAAYDENESGYRFAAGGGGGAARSFFEGTRYTPKVLQQLRAGAGEFHSFPESVTAFESAGTVRTITGGDGVARQMLEIPGSYATSRGTVMDGVFQFIKEADGAINHRLFVPRTP